jgi:hypothetical protein
MSRLKQLFKHSLTKGVMIGVLGMGAIFGVSNVRAQDNNVTYYACVNNNSGTIKMVNENTNCSSSEVKVTWNQVGPKGDKGDTGATGLQGPKGDKGDKGETGAAGSNGEQGLKGDKGDTGAAGPQGLQGEQGLKGDKGDSGAAGSQGLQGEQGLKGDKGDSGSAGAEGAIGPQGPKGDQGEKGDTGATGPQGPKGDPGQSAHASLVTNQNFNAGVFLTADSWLNTVGYSRTIGTVDLEPGKYKIDVTSYFNIPVIPDTQYNGVIKVYIASAENMNPPGGGDRLIAYGTFGKSGTSFYSTSLSGSYIHVNDTSTVNKYYIKTYVFTFNNGIALPGAPTIFYSYNVIKLE